MTPEQDDLRKKLCRTFTTPQMSTRSEVWCDLCNAEDKTCPHPVGICLECGEHLTVAHDHITFVPIDALRNRFNEIDPNWSWKPMGKTPQGNPAVITHGRFEVMWIKLTILGTTHRGVGQVRSNDRRYGPAGLKSLAIANAALEFGVGKQARANQDKQRINAIQQIDADTVTTPNMPDLPEGGAPNRSTHEAVTAAMGMDLKDVKAWLKRHHPDLKLPTGRMVGPNLMRIENQTGVSPADIRQAIEDDTPLAIETESPTNQKEPS